MKILEMYTVISKEQADIIFHEAQSSKKGVVHFDDTTGYKRVKWHNIVIKDFRGDKFTEEIVKVRVQLEKRYHSLRKEDYLRVNIYLNSDRFEFDCNNIQSTSDVIEILKKLYIKQPCIYSIFENEDEN